MSHKIIIFDFQKSLGVGLDYSSSLEQMITLGALWPRLKRKEISNFCCYFPHNDDSEDRFCLRLPSLLCAKNKTWDTNNDATTTIQCHLCSARNLLAPEVSTLISMKRTFGAEVIFVAFISSFALRLINKPCCNHLLQINSFLVELLLTII